MNSPSSRRLTASGTKPSSGSLGGHHFDKRRGRAVPHTRKEHKHKPCSLGRRECVRPQSAGESSAAAAAERPCCNRRQRRSRPSLFSLGSSPRAANFSDRASPGRHRWRTGTVDRAGPANREGAAFGASGWLQGGTSGPGAMGLRRSTRTARPEPRPGLAALAPFRARPTFALVPMATRQRAPGAGPPASGGRRGGGAAPVESQTRPGGLTQPGAAGPPPLARSRRDRPSPPPPPRARPPQTAPHARQVTRPRRHLAAAMARRPRLTVFVK